MSEINNRKEGRKEGRKRKEKKKRLLLEFMTCHSMFGSLIDDIYQSCNSCHNVWMGFYAHEEKGEHENENGVSKNKMKIIKKGK